MRDQANRRNPLREALRSLPRERASDDFTARLLERAAAPRPRSRRAHRAALAAAALLAALAAGLFLQAQREAARSQERRSSLALRHEELRRELSQLRRRVADPPTLYLGATADYDLVLDLEPWLEPTGPRAAVHSPDNP